MHRERFISNSVFLFGTGLVAQIVGLFVLPLFIKNLGEQMYGLFVISNVLIGYAGLLDFGFTVGLARHIGRAYGSGDQKSISDTISSGFWLLVAVGLAAASCIYFGRFAILDFLNVEGSDRLVGERLLVVTAIFSLFQWPLRLPRTILNGTLHIKQQSIVEAATSVLSSLTMLLLVFLSEDVVSIRIGVCLVMLAGLLTQSMLVRRYVPGLHWHPFKSNITVLKQLSGYSLGMFYTRLLSMLSSRVDHLIIGAMISVGAITGYAVAERVRRFIVFLTQRLSGALLPTVFSLDNEENRQKLQTLLDQAVRYRALLISPLAYLGIIISPAFIQIWMGEAYVEYAIWSQLFMIPILLSIFGIATIIARGTGKLKAANSVLTIRVLTNLVVSIGTVPYLGIGGPILGTIVAQVIFGDAVTFPLFCRICNLNPWRVFGQAVAIIGVNIPVATIALIFVQRVQINGWLQLIATAVSLLCIFYLTLMLLFVKNREKRDLMLALDAIGIEKTPRLRSATARLLGL